MTQLNPIMQAAINAKKRVESDDASSGDNGMGRYENVILNNRVMPNMIPGPADDIITNPRKWLNNVIF
jgi:hypothetical protein